MTISYVRGDIFKSHAQVLVNPVNRVGVMGKGLALAFKQANPAMFEKYAKACKAGVFTPGKLQLLHFSGNQFVLNFPTKNHWKNASDLHLIELGLAKFVQTYRSRGITSIAFPKIGAGLGGLSWAGQVKPLMLKYLADLDDVDIEIYVGR